MLENKKCVVISWDDKREKLYGLIAKKGKGGSLSISKFVETDEFEGDFSEKLSHVYRELSPSEQHLVVLGGYIPRCVCFELRMPKMSPSDLYDAIGYDLPRYVPTSFEKMVYGYRVIPEPEKEGDALLRLRVMVCDNEVWEELLSACTTASMKVDLLIHPFMAFDPLLSDRQIVYLPQVHEDLVFSSDSNDGLRKITFSVAVDNLVECQLRLEGDFQLDASALKRELPDACVPGCLLANYALGHEVTKDHSMLNHLPKHLVPERFRGLRVSFIFMMLVVLGLLISFFSRLWWEDRERYFALRSEIEKVDRKTTVLKNDIKKKSDFDTLIRKIYDADVGNDEVVHGLQQLTKKIPTHIWVKNFQSRGFDVDLQLETLKDASADTKFLDRLKNIYDIEDMHTRKNVKDGTTTIYVRLVYKTPRREKKGEQEWRVD